MITLIYISIGCELGMDEKEMNKISVVKNCEVDAMENTLNDTKNNKDIENHNQINTAFNEDVLKEIERQLNFGHEMLETASSHSSMMKKNNINKTDMLKLNKSINYIHSICEEFAGIYIAMFFIFTILIIYYGKKETKYGQQFDGKWRYESPLDTMNLVVNLLQFILITYLIVKVMKVWNLIYIFSCLKYIGYSTIIWITMGPIINV